MKYLLLSIILFLTACGNPIKNEDNSVEVEVGTEASSTAEEVASPEPESTDVAEDNTEFLGSWVGYFRKDTGEEFDSEGRSLVVDEGFIWNRENKINISIDRIIGDSVIGHSVVAGNDRPFYGRKFRDRIADPITFILREPGDDKYDGEFRFYVEDGSLEGTWTAYGDLEIKNRKYQLERKTFAYDPEVMVHQATSYVDWNKSIQNEVTEDFGEGEVYEWIQKEFASATNAIYEINASTEQLSKEVVENLKKGDLTIIRNAIYARHGYSFKHRPLRVFFDAQPWYIPVHTDIRSDFTELEKENIQLLLKYEKNAAEYYDTFGRG